MNEIFKKLKAKSNKKWRSPFFVLALMLSATNMLAQQVSVSGTVSSQDGPLPAASVVIQGKAQGVTTDFDGNYTIAAEVGDVLVFSYVGYYSQQVTVRNGDNINVMLSASNLLDEVVVVGYGTQKKSDLTGSVSLVDTEELQKQASNDVAQMMQGRIAGVSITTDGQPGASPNVRIRGVATFGLGASAEPLYVVDGFTLVGGIRDLNPNDIESIQVLKDATAGAIYGNRAANGVVIITTKSGRKNKEFSLELNSYYGFQSINQRVPVLDRAGYQSINAELLTNAGQPIVGGNDPASPLYVNNVDTDWQDVGYKDGSIQNYNLNASGGNDTTSYFVSLDYLENEGTLVGSGPDYKRYSFRVNSDSKVGKFNFGENFYLMRSDENPLFFTTSIGLPGGRPSLVNDLLQAAPTIPLYDENRLGGFGGADSTIHQSITLNVPGANTLINNTTQVTRILANFYAGYEVINGLNFKTSLQYDSSSIQDQLFVPQYDLGYFFPGPVASLHVTNRNSNSFLIENTLNWTKQINKHDIGLLIGQTYQKTNFRSVGVIGSGLSEPYIFNLQNATSFSVTDNIVPSAISSLLARLTYSFDDTYLLTANIRRDGSSKFRKDLRHEYFPSVGLGVKLQNQFDLPDFISELKLRGGIGEVGNQEIGDFRYQGTVNRGIPYEFAYGGRAIGAAVSSVIDKDIKWETRVTKSVGLDAVLFNGSLDFTAEYYSNTSNDVLTTVPIAFSNGSLPADLFTNAGSIKNSGVEFSAVYREQIGDFSFEIAPNFYTVNNEVLEIGGTGILSGAGARTEVGRSLGEHYGWVYDGLFQSSEEVAAHAFQSPGTAAGDIRFKDLNDDGVINDDDRTYLGSGLPTYNFGINFTANFKGFDFTVFGQGSGGNLINSNLYRGLMPTSGYTNWHEDILNHWTPSNTNTDVPRVIFLDPNNNGRDSNRPGWLQKGDYFRLNTISLGYSLPDSVLESVKLSKARFYVTLQNLAVFKSYKGYNPDFQSGILNPGFDYGTFPRPTTTMVGAQFKF